MALITWQDMLERGKRGMTRGHADAPILTNRIEYKKYFDYYTKNFASKYRNLPKAQQLENLSDLINLNLKNRGGKFSMGPGQGFRPISPEFRWDALVEKDPKAPEAFENYLKNKAKTPGILEIAKKKIPLKDKYNLLSIHQKLQARNSMQAFKATEGRILLKDFAPLTNFSNHYIRRIVIDARKNVPKSLNADNIRQSLNIIRAKEIKDFFTKNNIEIFQTPIGASTIWRKRLTRGRGDIYFTNPNSAQRKALEDFLNLKKEPSTLERKIIIKDSHKHPLYKDTSKNLRSVLNTARDNLNNTIEGYNNKGLKKFLKQNPRMLKNATMWFNPSTGEINYTSIDDIYKKNFNMGKLRESLKFEIEHNRPVMDYWNRLSKDGKISAKNALLNDAEFAHNLSVDTSRYNRGAKESIAKWIEKNPTELKKITALETELADLGHRFYAGDKWRGRELKIKSGYRDTVLDSWSKALEKSTGLKWSDQVKNVTQQRWGMAMKEVTHDKNALRQLGTFLGCPRTFAAEGGRIGFQTGGTGLTACVSTKLKKPGALEKIAALPEEMGGALSKLKNTATTFLGMLGRVGTKAAPLAALAVAGAGIEPLVKYFRNDDPSTYLTDESQMKGMLLATIEGETPKVDEEILKWQYPGMAASAAAAIPGSKAVYKARRLPFTKTVEGVAKTRAAMGIPRAALGPVGKFLAGTFSPLGVAATLPISVAAQRKGGTEWGDIATDPFNWMAPAFAATGAEMATKGIKNPLLLKALRLGMKPSTLRMISSRFGIPGLAISAGLWGYDKWKNRSINDPDE